jgi:hypothetical protein
VQASGPTSVERWAGTGLAGSRIGERLGIGWIGPRGTGRLDQHRTPRRRYAGPAVAELKTEQIIALLAPIVIIQLGLMVAALYDLEQEDRRVRGGSKLVWALVIVFVNIIGPIVYLVAGREEA